jgi:hypothetical protein
MSGNATQEEIRIALQVKGVYEIDETGEIGAIYWNKKKYDKGTEQYRKAEIAH